MAVIASYEPPPAAAARQSCCADCASPSERRRFRRQGAALVLGTAVRRARGQQLRGSEGEEDPLIWWPGSIRALIERTNTEVWTNARDFSEAIRNGRISGSQLAAFKDFFNEWDRYYKDAGFLATLTGATVATVKNYRVRNTGFRSMLTAAGVSPSSPTPTGLPTRPVDWEGLTKWIVGGAVVIGGAVALGHVVKAVTLFKSPARSSP